MSEVYKVAGATGTLSLRVIRVEAPADDVLRDAGDALVAPGTSQRRRDGLLHLAQHGLGGQPGTAHREGVARHAGLQVRAERRHLEWRRVAHLVRRPDDASGLADAAALVAERLRGAREVRRPAVRDEGGHERRGGSLDDGARGAEHLVAVRMRGESHWER